MTVPPRAYWQHQSPLEGALLGEVSSDRLMEHVRTIGAWERESGTTGEARSYDYIEGRLKEYGWDVERAEVEALISLPQERLCRALVPLAYTTGDRFAHDLALPVPPLAGLQQARDLATLDPGSDAFKFTLAALGRERNRAVHTMEGAADLVDGFLAG